MLTGRTAGAGLQAADAPADSSSPEPPDWSGAYTRAGQPSQAHRQWLAILSILGSLLRVQPDSQPVADAALALVITGQDRLLAAVAPPAGSADQPLTLAGLQVLQGAAHALLLPQHCCILQDVPHSTSAACWRGQANAVSSLPCSAGVVVLRPASATCPTWASSACQPCRARCITHHEPPWPDHDRLRWAGVRACSLSPERHGEACRRLAGSPARLYGSCPPSSGCIHCAGRPAIIPRVLQHSLPAGFPR